LAIEEKDYSQCRTCALIGLAPKTYLYLTRRPDDLYSEESALWCASLEPASGHGARAPRAVPSCPMQSRQLDAVIAIRGRPRLVVSDTGSELRPRRRMLSWQQASVLALHSVRQADPERLHRAVHRAAQRPIAERDHVSKLAARPRNDRASKDDKNEHRPDTSPNGLTPNEFATRSRDNQSENGICL
jgi:hypothetical protein